VRSLDDYKRKVIQLDRELKSVLNAQTVDDQAVHTLQTRLDNLSDEYHNEDLGVYLYKLYEIQAYLHFVRSEFSRALQFLEEAVHIRGRSYFDAESLAAAINTQKANRDKLIVSAVRQKAKKQIISGTICFALGLVISGISYSIAQHNAEQQAIANGQRSYSFSYWASGGAIIIGSWQVLRGIFDLANSTRKSQQIIVTVDNI
jgi:hypothetical protein